MDLSLAQVVRYLRLGDWEPVLTSQALDHNARPEEVCFHCGIYFCEECLVRKLIGRRCFYTLHKARAETNPAAAKIS
jgi:hypothetical protein